MISARRLSDVEASFFYLHRECQGSTQVVTRISMPGRWMARIVRERLQAWSVSHPLLLARVEERDAALWFAYDVQPGNCPHVQLAGPDFDPAAELARELNTPLHAPAGLWRLNAHIQLDAVELYLTRNHVISDAYTTRLLVNSLIEAVTGAGPHGLRGQPLLTDRTAHAYQPPPPGSGAGADAGAVPLQPHMLQLPVRQRRTEVISRVLGVQRSTRLKAYCKANRVTVNQLFSALLMQAYAAASGQRQLNFYTAVNTRSRYADHAVAKGLGCNIGVLRTPMSLDSDDLLDTVRQYRERLAQEDAAWSPASGEHAALLRNITALAHAPAFGGICLTNSGEVDPPPALARHARLVQTVVNRSVANYAMVLHLPSFGGVFHLNFTHAAPTMSTDFGLAVVERLFTCMDQVTMEHRASPSQTSLT